MFRLAIPRGCTSTSLPRADRDGGLQRGATASRTTSTVDPPAPREVRDGGRHRPVRGPRRAGDERPRRAVRDATLEPRRESTDGTAQRNGDRAWVVTGETESRVGSRDAHRRCRWPPAGASAVAFDPAGDHCSWARTPATSWRWTPRRSTSSVAPAPPRPLVTVPAGHPGRRHLGASHRSTAASASRPSPRRRGPSWTSPRRGDGRSTVGGRDGPARRGTGNAIVARPVESRTRLPWPTSGGRFSAAIRDVPGDAPDAEGTSRDRRELTRSADRPPAAIDTAGCPASSSTGGPGRGGRLGRVRSVRNGRSPRPCRRGRDDGPGAGERHRRGHPLWAPSTNDASGEPEVSKSAVSGDQAKESRRIATRTAGARHVDRVRPPPSWSRCWAPHRMARDDRLVIEPHGRSVRRPQPAVRAAAIAPRPRGGLPGRESRELLAFGADGETASLDVGHYPSPGGCRASCSGPDGRRGLPARPVLFRRRTWRPRRPVRPAGRDVLRPEPDRDNDVNTGVHPSPLPPDRVAVLQPRRMRPSSP